MESQPQNLEFRNNPESFHPCCYRKGKANALKLFNIFLLPSQILCCYSQNACQNSTLLPPSSS